MRPARSRKWHVTKAKGANVGRKDFREWVDALDVARKAFSDGQVRRTNATGEAVYATWFSQIADELALFWVKGTGPAFAVRAFAETFAVNFGLGRSYAAASGQPHPRYSYVVESHHLLLAMRRAMAGVDASGYDAARKAAEAIFAEAPLSLRCSLAFVFPDTWTDAVAHDVVLGRWDHDYNAWMFKNGTFSAPLLGATANPELAHRIATFLVANGAAGEAARFAPTLVGMVGAPAAASLAALGARTNDLGS